MKISTVMVLKAVAIVRRAHACDNDWDVVAMSFIALFRELDPGFDEAAFRSVVHLNGACERMWSR